MAAPPLHGEVSKTCKKQRHEGRQSQRLEGRQSQRLEDRQSQRLKGRQSQWHIIIPWRQRRRRDGNTGKMAPGTEREGNLLPPSSSFLSFLLPLPLLPPSAPVVRWGVVGRGAAGQRPAGPGAALFADRDGGKRGRTRRDTNRRRGGSGRGLMPSSGQRGRARALGQRGSGCSGSVRGRGGVAGGVGACGRQGSAGRGVGAAREGAAAARARAGGGAARDGAPGSARGRGCGGA